jgi:hypothetical protein
MQQLTLHPEEIRIINGDYVGFDASHPDGDPQWDDELVLSCFERRKPHVPAEVQTAKRKARYQRFYQKRQATRSALVAEWKPKLDAGEITLEEYEEKLASVKAVGFWRHIYNASMWKSKFERATQQLQGDGMREAANFTRHLKNHLTEIYEMLRPARVYDESGQEVMEPDRDAYGKPLNQPAVDEEALYVPMRPIPIPTWSKPSLRDYLYILCLVIPPTQWPAKPLNKRSKALAVKILQSNPPEEGEGAPTGPYPRYDKLGIRISKEERLDILQCLNTGAEAIETMSSDVGFEQTVADQYAEVQREVVGMFMPTSQQVSPLAFMKFLEDVGGTLNASRIAGDFGGEMDEVEDGA